MRLLLLQESVPDALGSVLGPLGWVIGTLAVAIAGGLVVVVKTLRGDLEKEQAAHDASVKERDAEIRRLNDERAREKAETLATLQHVLQGLDGARAEVREGRGQLSEHDRAVQQRLDAVRGEIVGRLDTLAR